MPTSEKAVAAATGGIAVSLLFELARREVRAVKLQELRAETQRQATQHKMVAENTARQQNLARMRAMTSGQLGVSLARSGVPAAALYQPTHALMQEAAAGMPVIRATTPIL